MKKILGIALLLMLVVGAMGMTSAVAADCVAPVSIDCTDTKGTEDPADDEHCFLWVDLGPSPDPQVPTVAAFCDSDVPPPPAL